MKIRMIKHLTLGTGLTMSGRQDSRFAHAIPWEGGGVAEKVLPVPGWVPRARQRWGGR